MHTGDDNKNRPFISSTRRFSAPSSGKSSNPVPGNYNSSVDWQPKGSVGHKGYGPFASSSSRLSSRIAYTGPGPASYSPSDPGNRHTHSAASCSAVFHKPQHAAAAQSSGTATPVALSPGQYTPATTHTGEAVAWASSRKAGATAAFRATSRDVILPGTPEFLAREQQKLQEAKPIPEWIKEGLAAEDPRLQGARDNAHNKARPRAKQRGGVAATSAQLANRLGAVVFGQSSGRSVFTGAGMPGVEVPGPGSYNIQAPSNSWQRPSPMFVPPLVAADAVRHQRARSQTQLRQVAVAAQQAGQGLDSNQHQHARHPDEHINSSSRGVSAPFRSRSPGHHDALLAQLDKNAAGVPGPAYYKPLEPPKKMSYRQGTSKFAAV